MDDNELYPIGDVAHRTGLSEAGLSADSAPAREVAARLAASAAEISQYAQARCGRYYPGRFVVATPGR